MEFQVEWLWPLLICGVLFALREWLTSHRRLKGTSFFGRWIPQLFRASRADGSPIALLARKSIGPQQTLVLVSVWDQELALCLQTGVAPALLATRTRRKDDSTAKPFSDPVGKGRPARERWRNAQSLQTSAFDRSTVRNSAASGSFPAQPHSPLPPRCDHGAINLFAAVRRTGRGDQRWN